MPWIGGGGSGGSAEVEDWKAQDGSATFGAQVPSLAQTAYRQIDVTGALTTDTLTCGDRHVLVTNPAPLPPGPATVELTLPDPADLAANVLVGETHTISWSVDAEFVTLKLFAPGGAFAFVPPAGPTGTLSLFGPAGSADIQAIASVGGAVVWRVLPAALVGEQNATIDNTSNLAAQGETPVIATGAVPVDKQFVVANPDPAVGITLTLPAGGGSGLNACVRLVNVGSVSTVTINDSSGNLINGAPSFALLPGRAVECRRFGSGWAAFGG